MPTVPNLDPSSALADTDLLWLTQGMSIDRNRKLPLGTLAEFTQRFRGFEVLDGTGAVTYDSTGKSSVLVLVSGDVTSVSVTGTPSTGVQLVFLNGTSGPVVCSSASGFLGFPVTPVASITMGSTGDFLIWTCVPNPPLADAWVAQAVVGSLGFGAFKTLVGTTVESVSPDEDPEFVWTSSSTEQNMRTITLPAGKWLLDAQVLFRAPTGGTSMSGSVKWVDLAAVPRSYGAGFWGGGISLLLGVPVPKRVLTLAAETTYTLAATLYYAGGTGNPGAWATLTAHRIG